MALVATEMVEGRIAALVLLVDQYRMPLRESAALAVLPRQPDMAALLHQRAERQRLAGRPVEADAAVDCFRPVVEEPLNGAVDPEAIRHFGDLATDLLEHRDIDPGNPAARIFFRIGRLEAGPFAVEPVGLVGL